MNKQIKKQLSSYYINSEITNKLFINPSKLELNPIVTSLNFKFSDIKLIKNLINLELIGGKRPTIRATLWKKSMILNLRSSLSLELVSYLQKSPVVWSKYLETTQNITDVLFQPSLTVKNNKVSMTVINHTNNLKEVFIKSAYLD